MERWNRTGGVLATMIAFCLAAGCSSSSVSPAGRGKAVTQDAGVSNEVASPPSPDASNREVPLLVTLFPFPPTGKDPVEASLRDSSTHAKREVSHWTWYRNGEKVGSDGPVLPAGEAKRGDEIWAEASAVSGGKGVIVASPRAMVVNSLPSVSDVGFNTLSPTRGETLKVVAKASDPDGDPVRLTYKWVVNGRVAQEGEKDEYRLFSEKKGDRIHCEAYPHDGYSSGNWSATPVVEIQNSPPRFLTMPPASAGPDGTFSYRISVEDVDGDPVRIDLLEGPEGMNLDHDTLRWTPEAGNRGVAEVVIRITDGSGGETRQMFNLTVSPG